MSNKLFIIGFSSPNKKDISSRGFEILVCYCNVSYILSFKCHEKAKNENCAIKFILKECH